MIPSNIYEIGEDGTMEGEICRRIKQAKIKKRWEDVPCGNAAIWSIKIQTEDGKTRLPICRECLAKVTANMVAMLGYD